MRLLIAVLLLTPAFAADPPGFALWKQNELRMHEEALAKKVQSDHSARETLADYKTHRFRMLYRDADGVPEQHDNVIDIVMVQSGEGTLVLGGTMIGLKASAGAGEYIGTGIQGGEEYAIAAGDIIHIPAKIPHRFLVTRGKQVTYVLLKIPA